ncbi:SDR family oxidoreductase [Streptomyces sp. S465]|uniref:SDR family oxidoreductase n=1 Tax=Streptomyces sp. S465 TaxID=2979468 RepID=UPI0022A88431|nr:SDR family oxidoreductase [Streptomyces sp. S465]WAP59238.1 SDR family oxidoreductase [Streptomyces sp. S465]
MKDLMGKVALVTGGSKGVGKAIARTLADRGAAVVLNYFHSHDQAKRTRDELVARGARIELARASVARQEQVDRMFAEIEERHGRLDILINSAANGALLPLAEVTDEDIAKAIDTNYKGGLRCARAAAPLMARTGGGSIVTVSALGGSQMVMANYSACAPAKAAAEAATRYLAVEFAPLGIRVNTASAAMLESEVADKFPRAQEMQEVIAKATPFGRLGTPEEFADVVAFLASDASRWITGQVVLADGGLTLGAALLSPPTATPTAGDARVSGVAAAPGMAAASGVAAAPEDTAASGEVPVAGVAPASGVAAVSEDARVSGVASAPRAAPAAEEVSAAGMAAAAREVPASGAAPVSEDARVSGVAPASGVAPTADETAAAGVAAAPEDTAASGEAPAAGVAAASGEVPASGVAAVSGEIPASGVAAVLEEVRVSGVAPVPGMAAASGETAAAEEVPAAGMAAAPRAVLAPEVAAAPQGAPAPGSAAVVAEAVPESAPAPVVPSGPVRATGPAAGVAGVLEAPDPAGLPGVPDDAIAVVGMGLAVAGANSPEEFWKLRTTGDELFVKIPRDRWRHENFHAADTAAEDKAYADRCVFITDFEAVPGSVDSMADGADDHELTTMWLRHSLVQALGGVRRRDTDRCSFVVGYTPDGSQHLEEAGVLDSVTRMTRDILRDLPLDDGERAALGGDIEAALARRYWRAGQDRSRFLPHRVGELAMRGLLPPSTELHMVDTACSSSLYAIDIAAKGLLMGKQDIAVCGGAFALAPRGTVLFSKLQGLSKRGEVHALDEDADGVIFADGAALVVLKRLSRARADGDKVLGVLRAFGSSSDGKGKAIYAPNAAGQSLAVRRALEAGEVEGGAVQWVNAHATGTPAGDLAEFTTLREYYGTAGPAAVTSNKSLIGHTGWAAGVVSLIENLLGLAEHTIPGQFRFSRPREDFRLAETGLEITPERKDWPGRPDGPRLAAVSGFGFGGTNAHLIVSEYSEYRRPAASQNANAKTTAPATVTKVPDTGSRVAIVGWSAHLPGLDGREEVTRWLGGGPRPRDSFGEEYPAPPFSKVRLPPKTIRALDRCQLMIVECAHQLRDRMPEFWQERALKTGVFVGHMGPTRAAMLYANRCYLDDIAEALGELRSEALPGVLERLGDRVRGLIPASNEDSFPGQMPNIISARVANYFDLNGPNMTMDSGFASAVSSITSAARYLRTGELDFALAGGINGNSLPEYRTLIGALLPPEAEELAEGAFLFALTTEERARAAGLTVLAYVDEPLGAVEAGRGESAPDEVLLCGAPAPEHARYLGAAGGLAVLKALHRPSGTVEIATDESESAAGARLRLTIPGEALEPGDDPGSGGAEAVPAALSAEAVPAALPAALPAAFATDGRLADGTPVRVRRQVPVLTELPARTVRERVPFLPAGAVVLTDAPGPLAEVVPPDADLTVLSTAPLAAPRPGWHHLPEVTEESVRRALAGAGPRITHLRVVGDLGAAATDGPAPALTALHDAAYLTLQHAYDDLGDPGSSAVALLLGAAPGGTPHPYTGLFTGLWKTAALERDACLAFALCTSATDLAGAIARAEEESAAERVFPVVFDIDGVRKAYLLSDEPNDLREGAPAVLGPDSVVVVAGGARGITAEVVKAVAEHFRPRIYVLGSNSLDDYPPETYQGTDEEFAARRSGYIKTEIARRDGRTVADINRAFDRMVNARWARRNLDEMAAHSGAGRVTYLTCDMRDGAGVDRAIGRVLAEQGRIDLLVNAAGLQRSGLIKDKGFAEFTAIRDLKLDSYLHLKRALRTAPPRLWCNFGSLLGYFGQLGEADYAAANDFLAAAATHARATDPQADEVTIGWTLWEGVGMGANELTKAYYERAGSYSNMAVAEGVHHFVQELHAPVRRPSVVHLGDAERATVERFYPGYLSTTGGPRRPGFFLRRLVASDERSQVHECAFDLETDGYLAHHTVRGEATLPGTFVTELAAEAARALVPGKRVIAFEDLRFEHFLRVYRDHPAGPKRIRAELVDGPGEVTAVQVRISEDVVAPSGVVLVRDRVHFRARVLLDTEAPTAPRWEEWPSGPETPVPDPYHQPGSPVRLTGPFVSTTDTRIHPRGKRARYAPAVPAGDPVWSRFTVPAILLDGLARVGVLDLVDGHLVPVAAPLSIRRIDLYEEISDHDLAASQAAVDLFVTPPGFDLTADAISNRFVAVRPDGRMLLQMKDMRATLIGYIDAETGEAVPAPQPVPGEGLV